MFHTLQRPKFCDFHIHSRYSDDGELSPAVLVQRCLDAGLQQMAITDHNCVAGAREAVELCSALPIRCRTGIEIDCTHQGVNFHVLGYDIDLEARAFEEIERGIRNQCAWASREQLRLFRMIGFDPSEASLKAATADSWWPESWTGEVFADVLLADERYRDDARLRPYRSGGSRSDNPLVNFYWDFCAQYRPCHVEMTFPEMREILALIHANGGLAVLAHPGMNLKGDLEAIEPLLVLGFDGIEAFSSYHSAETTDWLVKKAWQRGLLVSCGSDFHGKVKPAIQLGRFETAE